MAQKITEKLGQAMAVGTCPLPTKSGACTFCNDQCVGMEMRKGKQQIEVEKKQWCGLPIHHFFLLTRRKGVESREGTLVVQVHKCSSSYNLFHLIKYAAPSK